MKLNSQASRSSQQQWKLRLVHKVISSQFYTFKSLNLPGTSIDQNNKIRINEYMYVKYFLSNSNVQGVNIRNVAIFSFIAKKIQIMINMRLTLTAHHHYQVKTIQFVKGYTLFKLAKVVIETVLKMREGYLFILQNPFTSPMSLSVCYLDPPDRCYCSFIFFYHKRIQLGTFYVVYILPEFWIHLSSIETINFAQFSTFTCIWRRFNFSKQSKFCYILFLLDSKSTSLPT